MYALIILFIFTSITSHFYINQYQHIPSVIQQTELSHWIKSGLFYLIIITLHLTEHMDSFYNHLVTSYYIPTRFILTSEVMYQLIIFDSIYYIIHRYIFHHPKLYKHIHRIHHQSKTPYFMSTLYAHTLEHIITYIIVFTPSYIKPVHPYSLYIYTAIWLFYTFNSHTTTSNNIFNQHHTNLKSNYAMFPIIDIMFKTNH